MQVPEIPANSSNEISKFIQKQNKVEPTIIGGANMVEGEFINAK